MHQYSYAEEKLDEALRILATGAGDVRDRLYLWYWSVHFLNEGHFPDELKKDWQWITKQLTKYGPLTSTTFDGKPLIIYDSVKYTLKKIKNSTGVKIAKKVYDLTRKLHTKID
jgi:hypothetical protein